MLGFLFRETMRGTYYLFDAPLDERAIEFSLVVRSRGIRRFMRDRVASITGEVTLEKLAMRRPLDGTLGLHLREGRLPYEFTFQGDDGTGYRFRGQKEYTLLAPAESVSTLPASLYDHEGREIGRSVVRFDLRADTSRFVKSFRLELSF